jgi:hypothetical protein
MADNELGPIYTLTAARSVGMTRAQLRDDGVRVTRGAYVSSAVPLSVASAAQAALVIMPSGTVASHESAAVLLGAPVPAQWPLSFSVPPGRARPRRQRIRIHVRALHAEDVVMIGGLPVTSGPQTFLDLANRLPPDELVAVGDSLYRSGHLEAASLTERLGRSDGVRGVRRARACAPLLTPLAASRPESLVRYWLTASDLPDPEPQIALFDRWGREVAHADLGYRRWKVAIEYEGRQHAEREQFARDLERYAWMAADGWLLLRFGTRDLHRRERVVDRVAGALRSRGATW